MKKSIPVVLAFALFFLFFIQMVGTLIESIYVLDLMNTSLDAKALGVLFFFTPILFLPFRKKFPGWAVWVLFGLLIISRGITPSLSTTGRLYTSGVAVGTALVLIPVMFTAKAKEAARTVFGFMASAGLGLAVGLSVFLRTLNFSVDYSLTPSGAWSGWLLGLALASALTRLEWASVPAVKNNRKGVTPALFGIFLILTLLYFVFSAPAVLARWTEGNYALIIIMVSLLSLVSAYLFLKVPAFIERISRRWVVLWNILFTLSLTGTILVHRIPFPPTPAALAVVVGAPTWMQQVPLFLMLLLFPVIFLDMHLLFGQIRQADPTPRAMIPGLLLGSMAMVLLVFITIFTNVWGYIDPVSTHFRNMFWLPFFLITGALCLLCGLLQPVKASADFSLLKGFSLDWVLQLVVIFVVTCIGALFTEKIQPGDPDKTSLVVMTYNIQAGNDGFAEKSYDRQLAVIRRVSPDILALQETDTARIALNNDDYVRYFAGKLGYYSYYGPTTVTGTFGTAILSKYPLRNTRSVFTYSDMDEIGTAEAEVEVGGKVLSIHDVHPDGSATAKLAFARSLVDRSAGQANVIALGDFNLREDQEAYQVVAASYTDAWKSLHPSETGAGKGWIDHIFVSANLGVKDPTYLLPPDSASDHPAHWTTILWDK